MESDSKQPSKAASIPSSDRDASSGTSFGRFRDLEFLGKGGMAKVYRAYDPSLERSIALKFISGEQTELIPRFLLEAKAQARIDHKHVCKVYEVGEAESGPYIVMQLIRGNTLLQVMDELTQEQKLKLMKEVAEAVHAAHREGLIHRDLKPSNIMVERDDQGEWIPYVLDFGLARELTDKGLTATGTILGSPWYMSPEQARGEIRTLDRRTDVYSLGVTLYQLLTGKFPFEAESAVEVLMKLLNEESVPVRRWNSRLPADLQT
ncbi:MAG TPA: serine/threonine-protein kinase, partial [Acidobacteriota bacterium]|nr:serine/threonine-protein kinase [Acidobacteriota bacterium]